MSKTLKDVGVCLGIILFSGIIYWDSLGLRAGTFDPLGAGTMPRIVAVATIALALIAILQSVLGARRVMSRSVGIHDENFVRRPWLAVQIFGFMVAAAILLNLRVSFGVTSALFMFFSIMAVRRYRLSRVPLAAVIAVVCGFGLTYLFGALFGVDLP